MYGVVHSVAQAVGQAAVLQRSLSAVFLQLNVVEARHPVRKVGRDSNEVPAATQFFRTKALRHRAGEFNNVALLSCRYEDASNTKLLELGRYFVASYQI